MSGDKGKRFENSPLDALSMRAPTGARPPALPGAPASAAAPARDPEAMERTNVFLRDRHRALVDRIDQGTRAGARRPNLDQSKVVRGSLDFLEAVEDRIDWSQVRSEADLAAALAGLLRAR